MGSNSKFIKYTDAYHADWEVSATTLPTGSTRMDVLMGERRVGIHYIVTFYYASPDVGVNDLSIWLDSPDVCSMLLEHADITPQNLLGAMVSHTKSQASRNNMCSLDVNLPSYTTLGTKPYATFTERDFRYHNPIYTDDGGQFKAEYFIQKEMMYIQALKVTLNLILLSLTLDTLVEVLFKSLYEVAKLVGCFYQITQDGTRIIYKSIWQIQCRLTLKAVLFRTSCTI